MRRGTTPTITATVDADLTGMALYLAFKQAGSAPLVKTDADLAVTVEDGTTVIETSLTQAETLALREGVDVRVQLRAVTNSGQTAVASNIGTIPVAAILQDGELDG